MVEGARLAQLDPLLFPPGSPRDVPQPPASLPDLLQRVIPAGIERLPLPAPEAREPLLHALEAYASAARVPLPDLGLLRAQVQSLGVGPAGERALAQLVLAYSEALDLQREATAQLTPQESLLLASDPQAVSGWLGADASRSPETLQQEQARIAAAKLDVAKTLQASDLLARAVEEVRAAMASSASSPRALPSGDATAGPPAIDSWERLRTLTSLVTGPPRAGLRLQEPSLPDALNSLRAALGLPPQDAAELGIPATLPASLSNALALLVQAQADGLAARDPAVHARLLLDATQRAAPVLQAWGAVFRLGAGRDAVPDPASLVQQLTVPQPLPTAILAAAHGHSRPAAAPAPPPALAALLEGEGMAPADAQAAQASLPVPVASALAVILAAAQDLRAARAAALEPLTPLQRFAVDQAELVAAILAKESWFPEEAALVQVWAEGLAAMPPGAAASLRQAQEDVVAAVAVASAILEAYTVSLSLPVPPAAPPLNLASTAGWGWWSAIGGLLSGFHPLGSASAQVPPVNPSAPCPRQSPSSNCDYDIWFSFNNNDPGRGILVTGFGSTTIETKQRFGGGDPWLTIDLGGDDTYRIPAGTANSGPALPQAGMPPAVVDIGRGPSLLGGGDFEGCAILAGDPLSKALSINQILNGGLTNTLTQTTVPTLLGSLTTCPFFESYLPGESARLQSLPMVGVTLDMGGHDSYEAPHGRVQGVAAGLGTVGILWDDRGDDRYSASASLPDDGSERLAQGAGAAGGVGLLLDGRGNDTYEASAQVGQAQGVGAGGLLLDLDDGEDAFTARKGQGHSTGLLFDQAGATAYTLLTMDSASQGGSGVLVDLGGEGDTYTHPFPADANLPPSATVITAGEARRHDDALWQAGGFGLDSTLEDEDGDKSPNLVELLAGTDPQDPFSQPGASTPNPSLDDLLTITDDREDSDGDGFHDFAEKQAGSDPGDDESTPLSGILLDASCSPADGPSCVALLTVGGVGKNNFTHPAVVMVDLGGDDTYSTVVAGLVTLAGAPSTGSFSLDVGGSDAYGSAGPGVGTQGYAAAMTLSMLVDLAGSDAYATEGPGQGAGEGGFGFLIDAQDGDRYMGGERAQGFANAQASIPPAGGGALIDLGGDDVYTYETQGLAEALSTTDELSVGLFYDGAGKDTYNGTSVDPQHAISSADLPGTAFNGQGHADANAAGTKYAAGLFVDDGDGQDTYGARTSGGAVVALTGEKNDAVRTRPAASRPTEAIPRPSPGAGQGVFADNPRLLFFDADDDGVPGIAELLAGTDPNDSGDNMGSLFGAPGRDEDPADAILFAPAGQGPAGTLADSLLLANPAPLNSVAVPGLLIGGEGPSAYPQAIPFLVDLGGDDDYAAPNVGGSVRTGAVTLLLDLDGSDTYRPSCAQAPQLDPSVFTGTVPPVSASCVSLGGALSGISILADSRLPGDADAEGQRNEFNTTVLAQATLDSSQADSNFRGISAAALGVSQGAAGGPGAVGILATWDAGNDFIVHAASVANLTVSFSPGSGGSTSLALATTSGISQGAASGAGAVGILASFGSGDDTYTMDTQANSCLNGSCTPSGSITRLKDNVNPFGTATAARTDRSQGFVELSGLAGVLYDAGGANRYAAPHGFSQGASANAAFLLPEVGGEYQAAVGALWSGPGDDQYSSGPVSQGSANFNTNSLANNAAVTGLLLDSGGNDIYRLQADGPSVLLGQGASSARSIEGAAATGALVDLGGDDLYEAGGLSMAQGASQSAIALLDTSSAAGLLLDFGGNDAYHAQSQSQAFAGGTGSLAVLLDAHGNDHYRLDGPLGQGYGQGAVFLDGAGRDSYAYATPRPSKALDVLVSSPTVSASPTASPGSPSVTNGPTADPGSPSVTNGPTVSPGSPTGTNGPTVSPGSPTVTNGPTVSPGSPTVTNGPTANPGSSVTPPAATPTPWAAEGCNGCFWQVGGGMGVDARTLDQALAALGEAGVRLGTVRLDIYEEALDGSLAEATTPVGGTLVLAATVTPDPRLNPQVDRLDFLVRGPNGLLRFVGVPEGGPNEYRYRWQTAFPTDTPTVQAFRDGFYNVSASAFFRPAGTDASAPARPDLPNVDSAETMVALDNPPILSVSAPSVPSISPALRQFTKMDLAMGPDVVNELGFLRIDGQATGQGEAGHFFVETPVDRIPSAREGTAAVWTGSRVLVLGGQDGTYGNIGQALSYDPKTHAPIEVDPGFPAVSGASAVWDPTASPVCPSGCAYVFSLGQITRYNPAAAPGDRATVMPDPRVPSHASAVWDGAGHAYIFGGDTDRNLEGNASADFTKDILRYTPATGDLTVMPSVMPGNDGFAFGSAVWDPAMTPDCPSGCAYVFGGVEMQVTVVPAAVNFFPQSYILRYNPENDSVSVWGHLPSAISGTSAVWHEDRAWILGTDTVYVVTLSTGMYTGFSFLSLFGNSAVSDGTALYAFGGDMDSRSWEEGGWWSRSGPDASLSTYIQRVIDDGSSQDRWSFVDFNGFSDTRYARANLIGENCGAARNQPCPDGTYTLTVTAADESGQSTLDASREVLFDSTPPTSSVAIPDNGFSNQKSGKDGLFVDVHVADAGVGVRQVALLSLQDGQAKVEGVQKVAPTPEDTLQFKVDLKGRQVLNLTAVALDALGNSESPCQEGEADVPKPGFEPYDGFCILGKAAAADAIGTVTVDVTPPAIKGFQATPAIASIDAPVIFNATVEDAGSQVESVRVTIDGIATLTRVGDTNEFRYVDLPGGSPLFTRTAGKEEFFFAQLVAVDHAGNVATRDLPLFVDDHAPVVSPQPVKYLADGVQRGAARANSTAVLSALVRDVTPANVASVDALLPPALRTAGVASIACARDAGLPLLWSCNVPVGQVPTGSYDVSFRARDGNGNVDDGSTLSTIVVSTKVPILAGLRVADRTHDSITVAWNTTEPATSQVRYGQDNPPGQSTPLDRSLTTAHEVRITGLSPSTRYFLSALSQSVSELENQTATISERTLVGYTMEPATLASGGSLAGASLRDAQDFAVQVHLRQKGPPPRISVQLQEANSSASPIPVAQVDGAEGLNLFTIDTRDYADGLYRLVLAADRVGDTLTVHSPASPLSFRIDNSPPILTPLEPLPSAIVHSQRPTLRLSPIDPGGDGLPSLDTVTLTVDGAAVPLGPARDVRYEGTPANRSLVVTLPPGTVLGDGAHSLEVAARDAAGNAGNATWSFAIDTRGPRLLGRVHVGYLPGPLAARPEGTVEVTANLTDEAGVAAAVLDLSSLGADDADLRSFGGGVWRGSFRIPDATPGGNYSVVLRASDAPGNRLALAILPIAVDDRPPALLAGNATAAGFTQVRLQAASNEPTTLEVTVDGFPTATRDPLLSTRHDILVGGLRPNRAHTLTLRLVDGAGHATEVTLPAATRPDTRAPSRPEQLASASPREGTVELSWMPATDDAGIGAYSVARVAGLERTVLADGLPGNRTRFTDASAPAGQSVTYVVEALDLGGNRGPEASTAVKVLALPHLRNATVSPGRGTADTLFAFTVEYRHAGAEAPSAIEVSLGDLRVPMSRVSPSADCVDWCLYRAETRLAPTNLVQEDRSAAVHVEAGGEVVDLQYAQLPLVLSGKDGPVHRVAPGQASPAPAAALLLLGLLLAAAARRRVR